MQQTMKGLYSQTLLSSRRPVSRAPPGRSSRYSSRRIQACGGRQDALQDCRRQVRSGVSCVDEKRASDAWSLAGLSEGICAVQGYIGPAGGQSLNVPVIGSIRVELFAKAAMVSHAG